MKESIVVGGGIMDAHAHIREPGATHKEDFAHATRAALVGGQTLLLDMVNNPGAVTGSIARLEQKEELAKRSIYCDVGFNYRYQPEDDNLDSFRWAVRKAFGLKSMLEVSTGSNKQTPPKEFGRGWRRWHDEASSTQPIILHAETETIEEALAIAAGGIGHPTHVAHVSNRAELEAVMTAKRKGWPVTCEVAPHHLFMDQSDVQDWYQRMKPPLARPEDVEFLWRYIKEIDIIATDHAPHTKEEKDNATDENPVYGVPGLEAAVPLLFTALEREGHYSDARFVGKKIDADDLYSKLVTRPRQIFGLPINLRTSTRIEFGDYEFGDNLETKCDWSPYSGWLLSAKVVQVDLRGTTVYRDGKFPYIGRPGGEVVKPEHA